MAAGALAARFFHLLRYDLAASMLRLSDGLRRLMPVFFEVCVATGLECARLRPTAAHGASAQPHKASRAGFEGFVGRRPRDAPQRELCGAGVGLRKPPTSSRPRTPAHSTTQHGTHGVVVMTQAPHITQKTDDDDETPERREPPEAHTVPLRNRQTY